MNGASLLQQLEGDDLADEQARYDMQVDPENQQGFLNAIFRGQDKLAEIETAMEEADQLLQQFAPTGPAPQPDPTSQQSVIRSLRSRTAASTGQASEVTASNVQWGCSELADLLGSLPELGSSTANLQHPEADLPAESPQGKRPSRCLRYRSDERELQHRHRRSQPPIWG